MNIVTMNLVDLPFNQIKVDIQIKSTQFGIKINIL